MYGKLERTLFRGYTRYTYAHTQLTPYLDHHTRCASPYTSLRILRRHRGLAEHEHILFQWTCIYICTLFLIIRWGARVSILMIKPWQAGSTTTSFAIRAYPQLKRTLSHIPWSADWYPLTIFSLIRDKLKSLPGQVPRQNVSLSTPLMRTCFSVCIYIHMQRM